MTFKRGMVGMVTLACVFAAGMVLLSSYGNGNHPLIPGLATQAAETTLPPAPMDASEWRPAKPAERKAVTASITAQLQAFRKNDYNAAVIYQSAGLRKNFPSVGAFRSMMQNSYPQFTNYKTVTFGTITMSTSGQFAQAPVVLTAKDGTTVKAIYVMVLENKLFRVESVLGGASPVPELPTPQDERLT